ncbi:hypothetical protein GCM10009596_09770 [Arthrobacter rhombi]|uniref:hypothetical protein n=1 Tax=Arthrobacter rhombi TaxID=71253 RepID=UPI0031DF91B3
MERNTSMDVVRERVSRALAHRHSSISADVVLDILDEAVGTSETLTAGEQEFLTEHAGATNADFMPEAGRLTRLEITQRQSEAAEQMRSRALTTSDVARLLDRAPSNVRRSLSTGNLYSVGSESTSRERLFPEWQFTQDARIIPGLREVLEALPDDYHPLDVEGFMVTPQESLRGRSPAAWLSGDGDVEAVVRIADEQGWA